VLLLFTLRLAAQRPWRLPDLFAVFYMFSVVFYIPPFTAIDLLVNFLSLLIPFLLLDPDAGATVSSEASYSPAGLDLVPSFLCTRYPAVELHGHDEFPCDSPANWSVSRISDTYSASINVCT
jgi:hypothetical protein